jgi:arylsulfatase A-like enzyme
MPWPPSQAEECQTPRAGPDAKLTPLAAKDSSSGPPNVLAIVTDDQRLDGTMAAMPKTVGWFHTGEVPGRPSAGGGTAYPNAVTTTPLCCPSRSSILTGRYAHNHGIWDNELRTEPDPAEMLQSRLREATPSYRTGIFGKYLNSWTQKHPAPEGPPGFERWSIFEGGQHFPATVNEQGVSKTVVQYATEYFAEQAVGFLDEGDEDERPWFLYLAPATPHSPFTPDPKYAQAPVPPFQEPPSYFEVDRRAKPAWVRAKLPHPPYVQATRAAQLRMLRSVDDLVDRVMTKIAERGEDSNTLAFFLSDHGWHWGEHGLDSKGSPYLDSIRIPFFVRWPGQVPSAKTDPSLVANVDISPTILDAVGSPANGDAALDGRSLLGGSISRDRILTEYDIPTVKWASLLTPTSHYIETYEPGAGSAVWREYYDLAEDPHELTNLLNEGDESSLPTAELARQLEADRTCRGDDCPPGRSS